ncbi:MAG: NAD(P)-dependent oxidoreductase [Pseudomonadota bacterium]
MKVLVTGATGYLGTHLIRHLTGAGYDAVGLVRTSSDAKELVEIGAETVTGDVTCVESMEQASRDVDVIVHAAADTSGTVSGGKSVTINGTLNVAQLCTRRPKLRLVYISSCSVYGISDLAAGDVIDEESALEKRPELRGAYSHAKHSAEVLLRRELAGSEKRVVVLRPGIIFGRAAKVFSPSLGFRVGARLFLIIGPGSTELPLVHVDDVADAATRLIAAPQVSGVFNVVDPQRITKRMFMDRIIRPAHPSAIVVYVPIIVIMVAAFICETLFPLLGRTPPLTRYRLLASQLPVHISGKKLRAALGWTPLPFFTNQSRK